jgi:O-antigen/teichoic acid export membrane protein
MIGPGSGVGPTGERLKRNIVYNVLGQGLVLVLSLVAVRLVFARLGGDVVGIIFFVLTLSPLVVSAMNVGISYTVVREVSRYQERDREYVRDLGRTASTVCWLLYAGASVALLMSAPVLVTRWLHLTTLDPRQATELLQVLGVSALTALPRGFYGSVLSGLQRMQYNNGIDVSTAALQQGGSAVLLFAGAGSMAVVDWLACCFVISTAAYAVVAGTLLGWRGVLPGWSPAVIARNRDFSARAFAIWLLSIVNLQLDKLFVSKILPITVFGFYSFAGSLAFRATFVSVAITQATMPALASLLADGEPVAARRQCRRLHDLQCLLGVPMLALVLYGELPLVTFTFGDRVAQSLLLPVALLCLGFFLQIATTTPTALLVASGRPGLVARSSLLGVAAGAPVGLVTTLEFGLPGAALYFVVSSLVSCWYLVSRTARPYLGLAPAAWYLATGRVLLLGLLVYGATLAVVLRLRPSLAALAGLYALTSAVFAAVAYQRLMGPALKHSVVGLSGQLRLRVSRAASRTR